MVSSILSGSGSIFSNTKLRKALTGVDGGNASCAWLRQCSITSPACTPDGQAVVQARQSRQK